MRPITDYFDFAAGREWRQAMRRVTVRHRAVRGSTMTPKMVAGAVDAEAGQLDSAGWDPREDLGTGMRELKMASLEGVGEFIPYAGAQAESDLVIV